MQQSNIIYITNKVTNWVTETNMVTSIKDPQLWIPSIVSLIWGSNY